MKYRRAAAALLCATLALGLGACSGGSKDKSAQASKMYTWVSNESDRAQWDTFVKGVQETDPNFKLDIEGPSFQDYWTKIKTRMSSADAPCIVLGMPRPVGGASRAMFEPITQTLNDLSTLGIMLPGSPDEGPLLGRQKPIPEPPGRARLISRDHGVQSLQLAWAPPTR